MKKNYFLLLVLLSFLLTPTLDAQNLISGWDGNGITGDLSKPNDVGWLNTHESAVPWNTANAGGGCRFRDAGVGYTSDFTNEADGSVNTGRQLMLRYDNSAYSASIYAYPATLAANTTYVFSMDFVCGGSATPPKNMMIGASSTPNMTGMMVEQTITSTTSTTVYRKATLTFTTTDAGVYYITFKGDHAWFGVTNLNLVKNEVQLTELNNQYNSLDLGDLTEVTSDLTLPVTLGTEGVTVTWESSNEAIISNTGVVVRPEKYNKPVKLTATVSQLVQDSVYSLTKTFNAIVLGVIPTPAEVAQWDFQNDAITYSDGVIQVTDTKSGFVGTMKNEAKIRTIGETTQFNVLDLGNGTGYFDMGEEIGEAIYSLTNYTLCGYFRIDEDYPSLNSNGNFFWTFSNSDDIDADRNGYIIGSLKSQGVSVANYYNLNNTAANTNPADVNSFRGSWHHFAFVQYGNTGTVYIDGVPTVSNENMNLPAFLLPKEGKKGTDYNWLGRSNYKNDVYLRQTLLYDFRVLSEALSEQDINWDFLNVLETLGLLNTAYAENPNFISTELTSEKDNLELSDLSALTSDITLPTKGSSDQGISISWNSYSNLISPTGEVTRPDYFNYSDTLTATLFKNGQFVTKKFPFTILAKEGTAFTSDLLVRYDFSVYDSDSTITDVAEKKFKGFIKNDATISTIGTTDKFQVLNLGDSIGYFDMGEEMGKIIYHLEDYTISAYFKVDTAYHDITRAGNFLWNISNSKDLMGDKTGAIIIKLNDQGYSITPGNYTTHQALSLGVAADRGSWHNLTYTQSGNVGILYYDGIPMVINEEMTYLPKNMLRAKGFVGTPYNWLGRSSYQSDVYLRKTMVYDFRVYKKALTDTEIQTSELNVGAMLTALNKASAEGETGLRNILDTDYRITSTEGVISIFGLDGTENVFIYDISGRCLNVNNNKSSTYNVGRGIYIVRINNFASKVIVR